MQYLMIAPLEFLKKHRPDYPRHMVLAHLWNGEYAKYFKGKSIVLDNGEYEGHQVPLIDYVRIAMEADPFIVIAPDCMNDMPTSLIRTQKFLDYYQGNADVLGVVQGKDLHDRLRCYSFLVKMGVQAIGFPRCWKKQRVPFITLLKELDIWSPALLYSALGWTGSLHEVRQLSSLGVNYLDTSAPIWRGIHGYSLKDNRTWPDHDFNPEIFPEKADVGMALSNLTLMEAACKLELGTSSLSKARST